MRNSIRGLWCVLILSFCHGLYAGELYDELSGKPAKKILFSLFAKESFNQEEVKDLDQLWLDYNFSEQDVALAFRSYQNKYPIQMTAYQEVILWHTDKDVIPSTTTPEEFAQVGQLFHQKAELFGGTVRLIGGFLNHEQPYRKGLCRWIAPNTFSMLYVVRLAREPYFGPYFPQDGGTIVSQTLH